MECLAQWVLAMPRLEHRHAFLNTFEARAGREAASDLMARIARAHQERRTKERRTKA